MRKFWICFFLLAAGPFTALCGGAGAEPMVAHALVALCDNKNQGIVPVPARIGNGRDPGENLYWGAAYGVRTFFRKQADWVLLTTESDVTPEILQRLLFKHKTRDLYLVADAYAGEHIKKTTTDFLEYAAGAKKLDVRAGGLDVKAGGDAGLIVYIGHNGLMDFRLENQPKQADKRERQTAIFACKSKEYFAEPLKTAGAHPLIWTTNYMCPEAYSLHALINAWSQKFTPKTVREDVAKAYNQYQKCGLPGARRLFATGW